MTAARLVLLTNQEAISSGRYKFEVFASLILQSNCINLIGLTLKAKKVIRYSVSTGFESFVLKKIQPYAKKKIKT